MTRVYVAGPMRGLPQQNFPAFHEASAALRARGFTVVNPAELDEAAGVDPNDEQSKVDIRAAFRRDVSMLLTCDAVALLPGWDRSDGAKAELALARAVGMTTIAPRHVKSIVKAYRETERERRRSDVGSADSSEAAPDSD